MTDTITLPRSVVEQALEAMDDMASDSRLLSMSPTRIRMFDCARDDLRAALEQPQVKQEPVAWPKDAEQVRAFMGTHVGRLRYARDDHKPNDDDTYTLSAHDFLTAIEWWTDAPYTHPQPAQPAISPGWKLVPVEPTKDMKAAGAFAAMDQVRRSYNPPSAYIPVDSMALLSYRAMIAAAPQPPVVEQPKLYPLPDDLYGGSKDWREGSYAERVEWLHLWYESAKEQIAELEQPQVGEVVVTTNQEGQCVAVTRQDDDGCILSVIWEAQQPQVKQEPVAFLTRNEEGDPSMLFFDRREAESYCDDGEKPTPLYTHPQNLRCKSNQHRLATLWGYEKPQPPRQPLTDAEILMVLDAADIPDLPRDFKDVDIDIARAIEEAHGIKENT